MNWGICLRTTDYVLVSAGEDSGDRIGALFLEAALEQGYKPEHFCGLGGERMTSLGFKSIADFSLTAVNGFAAVFTRIFSLWSVYRELKGLLQSPRCRAVVLIDYPGMNMGLLKLARSLNKPVYYGAPPQVWVHKPERVRQFKQVEVQTLFEFEAEYYRSAGALAHYCGHPFASVQTDQVELDESVLLLLPGSRIPSIKKNIGDMLRVVQYLKTELLKTTPNSGYKIRVLAASQLALRFLKSKVPHGVEVVLNQRGEFIKGDFALSVPGTGSYELALAQIPSLVLYRLNMMAWLYYKLKLKSRSLTMINILTSKTVFQEFIFWQLPDQVVRRAVLDLIRNQNEIRSQLKHFENRNDHKPFSSAFLKWLGEV
jgi:lipid-A-disaccharide synthase